MMRNKEQQEDKKVKVEKSSSKSAPPTVDSRPVKPSKHVKTEPPAVKQIGKQPALDDQNLPLEDDVEVPKKEDKVSRRLEVSEQETNAAVEELLKWSTPEDAAGGSSEVIEEEVVEEITTTTTPPDGDEPFPQAEAERLLSEEEAAVLGLADETLKKEEVEDEKVEESIVEETVDDSLVTMETSTQELVVEESTVIEETVIPDGGNDELMAAISSILPGEGSPAANSPKSAKPEAANKQEKPKEASRPSKPKSTDASQEVGKTTAVKPDAKKESVKVGKTGKSPPAQPTGIHALARSIAQQSRSGQTDRHKNRLTSPDRHGSVQSRAFGSQQHSRFPADSRVLGQTTGFAPSHLQVPYSTAQRLNEPGGRQNLKSPERSSLSSPDRLLSPVSSSVFTTTSSTTTTVSGTPSSTAVDLKKEESKVPVAKVEEEIRDDDSDSGNDLVIDQDATGSPMPDLDRKPLDSPSEHTVLRPKYTYGDRKANFSEPMVTGVDEIFPVPGLESPESLNKRNRKTRRQLMAEELHKGHEEKKSLDVKIESTVCQELDRLVPKQERPEEPVVMKQEDVSQSPLAEPYHQPSPVAGAVPVVKTEQPADVKPEVSSEDPAPSELKVDSSVSQQDGETPSAGKFSSRGRKIIPKERDDEVTAFGRSKGSRTPVEQVETRGRGRRTVAPLQKEEVSKADVVAKTRRGRRTSARSGAEDTDAEEGSKEEQNRRRLTRSPANVQRGSRPSTRSTNMVDPDNQDVQSGSEAESTRTRRGRKAKRSANHQLSSSSSQGSLSPRTRSSDGGSPRGRSLDPVSTSPKQSPVVKLEKLRLEQREEAEQEAEMRSSRGKRVDHRGEADDLEEMIRSRGRGGEGDKENKSAEDLYAWNDEDASVPAVPFSQSRKRKTTEGENTITNLEEISQDVPDVKKARLDERSAVKKPPVEVKKEDIPPVQTEPGKLSGVEMHHLPPKMQYKREQEEGLRRAAMVAAQQGSPSVLSPSQTLSIQQQQAEAGLMTQDVGPKSNIDKIIDEVAKGHFELEEAEKSGSKLRHVRSRSKDEALIMTSRPPVSQVASSPAPQSASAVPPAMSQPHGMPHQQSVVPPSIVKSTPASMPPVSMIPTSSIACSGSVQVSAAAAMLGLHGAPQVAFPMHKQTHHHIPPSALSQERIPQRLPNPSSQGHHTPGMTSMLDSIQQSGYPVSTQDLLDKAKPSTHPCVSSSAPHQTPIQSKPHQSPVVSAPGKPPHPSVHMGVVSQAFNLAQRETSPKEQRTIEVVRNPNIREHQASAMSTATPPGKVAGHNMPQQPSLPKQHAQPLTSPKDNNMGYHPVMVSQGGAPNQPGGSSEIRAALAQPSKLAQQQEHMMQQQMHQRMQQQQQQPSPHAPHHGGRLPPGFHHLPPEHRPPSAHSEPKHSPQGENKPPGYVPSENAIGKDGRALPPGLDPRFLGPDGRPIALPPGIPASEIRPGMPPMLYHPALTAMYPMVRMLYPPHAQPPDFLMPPLLGQHPGLPGQPPPVPDHHDRPGSGPRPNLPGSGQPSPVMQPSPRATPTSVPPHHRGAGLKDPTPSPTGDKLFCLLQNYPVMWQGHLSLKNDMSLVQMHHLKGSTDLVKSALPLMSDPGPSMVRIAQRMRLEPQQLDSLAKRMQNLEEYSMLVAIPCGRDHSDMVQQTEAMKTGFIQYLLQKQAAGIVNVEDSVTKEAAYVIHIFPPCQFSNSKLTELTSPDLVQSLHELSHLIIIIATVG